MIAYLYYLLCPKTKEIRYIGQTTKKLNKRLQCHFDEFRRDCKKNKQLTHKQNWFLSLGEQYKNISIHLIEETTTDFVNQKEIELIYRFRKEGHPLTNIRHGGQMRHYHSDETRKKIANSKLGIKNPMFGKTYLSSQERNNKISNSLKSSEKNKEIRKSKKYREKISLIQNFPILVLNEQFEVVYEFRNCSQCAIFFGYTRGNIKNAVRFKRKIGKGNRQKFWIIRKESIKDFLYDAKSEI